MRRWWSADELVERWSLTPEYLSSEQVGSLGYEAQLGEGSGRVRLKYTTTRWEGSGGSPITGSSSKQRLNPSCRCGRCKL